MKLKFIFAYIIISVSILAYFYNEKTVKIENHLKSLVKDRIVLYNILTDNFKEKAEIIYESFVLNDQIIGIYKKAYNADTKEKKVLHDDLYSIVKDKYKIIKENFKIKLIHFHLKNSESFLRLHKPEKFGDSLVGIREGVTKANKESIRVTGYEMGKAFGGYRYVFPIRSDGVHLGSVEISFDAFELVKGFIKKFNEPANIHFCKGIIDKKMWPENIDKNFLTSPVHSMYVDKRVWKYLTEYRKKHDKSKPNNHFLHQLYQSLENNKSTGNIVKYNSDMKKVFIFIPIMNPISNHLVGYFSNRADGAYIDEINIHFVTIVAILMLLSATSLFILYRKLSKDIIYKEQLEKKVELQTQDLERQKKKLEEKNRLLETKNREINLINENLEKLVQEKTDENFKQFQTLQQQSKLAMMGEMIGAIAHQWRQPLNVLTIRVQKLKRNYKKGEIDEEFINKYVDENKKTIDFMSKTIDDFRNFFRIDKQKSEFDVSVTITEVIFMLEAQLKNHNIKVNIDGGTFVVDGYKREFQQVMINIINNAKDIFIKDNIANGEVFINIEDNKIYIENNGGLISDEIISRIFEPYFTTKDQGEGTGMGLYMSKMIIEDNMDGKLLVTNGKLGAIFIIELPIKGTT